MSLFYILIGILLLGILVTVHEWGHFISARLCGIEVREFAIGMGPKLFGWTDRHGTAFSLRLIPMGGYCAFYGEDDVEGKEKDDPRAWPKQAVWKRMISVLMGPGMNFLLAFLVLFFWLWIGGYNVATLVRPELDSVTAGGPAETAGFLAGDAILAINGVSVVNDSTDSVTRAIQGWQEGDEPLHFTVQRGEEELTLDVTPQRDPEDGVYRVGIIISFRILEVEHRGVGIGEALSVSGEQFVYAGGTILRALKGLLTRGEGLDQVGGPVSVVAQVSEMVRSDGLDAFLNLLVVISINLGIMNLLPIPGLDGSRFLFMVLEAIRRKPIPPEKEAMVHMAGMVLLFGLMIVVSLRDIIRLFQ